MKPVTPFDNFPSFGNAGARQAPGDAKYALGFVSADTFPAEWANYFFHGSTKGISDLNSAVRSMWLEMESVLAAENITPDAGDNDQLLEAINKIKDEAILAAHPVGSLYWTSSTENPAITFGGGTWSQIKDKFVLAAGDTYSNGGTGGSATVTLTTDQIPSHDHSFTPSGNISGGSYSFSGTEHSHSYTPAGSVTVTTNPSCSASGSTTGGGTHSHDRIGFYNPGLSDTTWGGKDAVYFGNFGGPSYSTTGCTTNVTTATTGFYYLYAKSDGSSHSHSVSVSGSCSGGAYKFTGTAATLKATAGGTISVSTNPSFNGTAGTTGTKGGGGAHDNMPPYVVKYCWERTA